MSTVSEQGRSALEALVAAIPAELGGRRLLDVGPGGEPDRLTTELEGRDAAELRRWDPVEPLDAAAGSFDLVVCRDVLQRDPHPANLLNRIWEATADGATLLLQSRVLTAAEDSMYARFVAASAGLGDSEWLPGRLALRWSVETSGFDVERWLDKGEGAAGEPEASACLLATRTARIPALQLATPAQPS